MKKTAWLAMAAMVIAACAKEVAPDTPETPQVDPQEELAPGTVVLKVGFEAPETQDPSESKVAVSDSGELTWKTDDQIAVWTSNGASGKFCTFTLYTGADEKSATFTGSPDEGYSVSTLAVYPASAAASYDGETLTVAYPDTYEYGKGAQHVRMAAYFDNVEDGLTFKHLGGLIRFSITNIPAGVNCFKLAADKPISGNFTVSANKEVSSTTTEADEVEIAFEAGMTEGQFAVPVPVGTYSFTAALYTKEGENYTLCKKSQRSTSQTIARNNYKQMKSAVIGGGIYYVKMAAAGDRGGSSWANATTLEQALFWAEDGETIKVAAGTYSASSIPELYTDAALTTPVTAQEWKVYVVTSNVTIEGGYAGSSESETPNYTANATIIDGSAGAAHGLAVAAPKATGKKVSVKGIKIANFTSPSANNPARTKDNVYLAGSYGSAIVARGTEVEFEQCTITGNTATVGGKCTVYGAGDGAIITFKDCTFSGNTADNGAAVNAHGSTVNLTGSTIVSGNTAAANLFQTDATGNIVITDHASVSENEAVNIINNTAAGGQTTLSGNAVISNNTATTVVLNAGTFNMAGSAAISGHSGITNAIANSGTAEITEGASISDNTASSYLVDNSATFTVTGAADADSVRFSGNTAPAILRHSTGPVTLTGKVAIANNTTKKAIRNEGSTFSMTGGKIYGNVSDEATGVIFNKKESTFTNVDIFNNTGTTQILYNYSAEDCILTFENCQIERNEATLAGGSIIFNNTGGTVKVKGGSISENTTQGSLLQNQGKMNVTDACTIQNNRLNMAANSSEFGLFLQKMADTELVVDGATITGTNRSDNTKFAAGVFFLQNGSVTISNSHIKNNTSHRSQGTVMQANGYGRSLSVKIYNSEVSGNTGEGGVYLLYFRTCAAAELANTTIANNTVSGNYGGAVALYGDSSSPKNAVKLISCTIVGNKAQAIGGLYMSNGNNNAYLYNTVLSGNIRGDGNGQGDYYGPSGALIYRTNSIITSTLYNASRNAVSGVTFAPASMIGTLQADGTVPMIGDNNPATGTYGMAYSALQGLNPGTTSIPAEILGKDQLGNSREGKTYIGAWVGNE